MNKYGLKKNKRDDINITYLKYLTLKLKVILIVPKSNNKIKIKSPAFEKVKSEIPEKNQNNKGLEYRIETKYDNNINVKDVVVGDPMVVDIL